MIVNEWFWCGAVSILAIAGITLLFYLAIGGHGGRRSERINAALGLAAIGLLCLIGIEIVLLFLRAVQ